ncbi:MAG: cbb3-type cytochrome oxidase assembly protein CcoS [Rubrivivax sp.]|nr:cbb3-type cytochrome oxidase assembly protein CcoS [Rubrivivax sp.]
MEILYLLIPLSAVLVLGILGIFGWALYRGQFEDLELEGERILDATAEMVDADQAMLHPHAEQSPPTSQRSL